MAEVYPFIGTRYNSQLIGNLGKVVCPPCDAISAQMQADLYERHEHNVVRLEHSREEAADDETVGDRFSRVANTLGTWRSDGVFIEDEKPSFYLYEQAFTMPTGETVGRIGFIAKTKLDEKTLVDPDMVDSFTGARAEYLNLIRSTKANISAVAAIFSDPENTVRDIIAARMQEKPWEEVVDDDGVTHRMWVVQKKEILLKLVEAMKSRQLFVVEGHQRYVSAQVYRDEMRASTGKADGKQPYDYIMTVLLPAEQDNLVVAATHRALTKTVMADVDLKDALEELEEYFNVTREKFDVAGGAKEAGRLTDTLKEAGENNTTIALVHGAGTAFYLSLKDDVDITDLYDDGNMPRCIGALDACILHNFIINQVMIGNPEYELEDDECLFLTSAEKVLDLLHRKKAVCGFLLNGASVPRMMEIAETGVYVPLEIGVLIPRPITGLVLRNMQTDTLKSARR